MSLTWPPRRRFTLGNLDSHLSVPGGLPDGTRRNGDIAKHVSGLPGFEQDSDGELHFAEWNCRAGQNNVIIRPDCTRTVFPHVRVNLRLGQYRQAQVRSWSIGRYEENLPAALLSTLNHNLAYCYNDARVIKFVWTNLVTNRMKGGARNFED